MGTLTLTTNKTDDEATIAAKAAAEAAEAKAAADEAEAKAAAPAVPAAPAVAKVIDFAALLGKRRWVKTVHGDMVNLLNNQTLTTSPAKVAIDQFVVNQLEVGKMVLHIEVQDE